MKKIKGVKIERTATGAIKSVIFNYKQHGELLEDILDILIVERFKESKEEMHNWEDVKAELNKKHKLK